MATDTVTDTNLDLDLKSFWADKGPHVTCPSPDPSTGAAKDQPTQAEPAAEMPTEPGYGHGV